VSSDSHIPDLELNKTPTREKVKEMLKHLPPDKAAGPDGITNRILQASGEQAIDMIYLYMLIIWEVETYPGAWVSALMQPIYKGGGKDRHSPVSYRGIYLLDTLTKLFEGLIETRLAKFTELNDTLTPSQQRSRITRQTLAPSTRLLPPYMSDLNTDSPATAASLTLLLPTHQSTENV